MDISLTQSGSAFFFPVLPASYSVSDGQNNSTVNVNAIGDINLLGLPTLTEISWDGFFPHENADYVQDYSMNPVECVNRIKTMMQKGVCDLHLLDVLADHVTIESFTHSEDDGTGDIKYSITLKKYIYITTKGVETVEIAQSRPDPETPRNGKTYTVKEGDSLWQIARRECNSDDWKSIYNANKATIGDNPNLIYPGQELTLS